MAPSVQKRQALGKGLGALIPPKKAKSSPLGDEERNKVTLHVPIEEIHPNSFQPRKTFPDATLDELAASIKEHGLMQPILVRKKAGAYEIIAGERRWRGCQRAGLHQVEVIVKDLADDEVFEWALIENIQREDLNPIEEAEAYRRLLDTSEMTQEQLASRVSKDRSTIANALRLLKLPDDVRRQVIAGSISMGHARALVSLDEPDQMTRMSKDIVKNGLSVREVERAVRLLKKEHQTPKETLEDPYEYLPGGRHAVERTTTELRRHYGTRVRIVPQGKRGRIEIDYTSVDELDRIISMLKD
ncbi:MAG: ParB/RepB/Spo0J family partition protein [Myxococcales bacterium]|nr:ParB/RepB/Spo0J family partition protein [Myxococcales bacterium]